ncbi:aldo-keto reductase-like [Pyrus ussuriensis x Pyrus communis]|uniref:Aldo-keto reductase-like n=1 Tax=Pyrus ussuriensis x Pyrus communis TaxID=2448454 RepID=A0A5N5F9U3_9ROSA|nr:aldo-keto reductase-like [Pyrus ussuriensis x Pyrus communis]
MALCSTAFLCNHAAAAASWSPRKSRARSFRRRRSSIIKATVTSDAKQDLNTSLQYRKLDDSNLVISEITLQTMTFSEQNTEIKAHEILYAVENGINAFDTADAYPIPMKEETQGDTDRHIASWLKSQLRDKVFDSKANGYSEGSSYLLDNATVFLKRLGTDYIDLIQIHCLTQYLKYSQNYRYFRQNIRKTKIDLEKANEYRPYLPIKFYRNPLQISILLTLQDLTFGLVEACHPQNYKIGLLAYSSLAGGSTSGKIKLGKKYGLTPVQIALGFVRDRPFVPSSIVGAASRPLPPEVVADIEEIFKRYKEATLWKKKSP